MLFQHKLPSRPRPPRADELAAIEAKLAELRAAEQAFARTHAELAARSDALSERRRRWPPASARSPRRRRRRAPELEALEARIRRLEQGGRKPSREPQTFSAGLRALQERGLRARPVAGRASTLDPVRGVSSAGRAPRLQRGGRRFDPGTLHYCAGQKSAGADF